MPQTLVSFGCCVFWCTFSFSNFIIFSLVRACQAKIAAAPRFVLRNAWCISGMERLQPALERERVRRRQGPADNAEQAVEAGRPHVQQVKAIFGV